MLATAPAPAAACGFDFPIERLAQRDGTLLELQEGVFADEVALLVPRPARRFAIVAGEPEGVRARGSPEERALYDRGAAAFRAGDHAAAIAAFTALLALPADLRRHRSTWAAYMIGRLEADTAASLAAFAQVRALVAAGFLDELGLAASSLGKEGHRLLGKGDLPGALARFGEQAAHGDPEGATAALFLARELIRGAAYRPRLAEPIVQRLLAGYLFSRADELTEGERSLLWRDLAAQDPLAGADRLAATAYRQGDWELAAALAARAPDASLARWVRAKLALRAGDRPTADRLLRDLAAGLTADPIACYEPYAEVPVDERIAVERAIVALADGHYPEAMAHAWDARAYYPLEWIRIAERVLTIEELGAFVAAHRADPSRQEYGTTGAELAALYARRLMREARFADALPHFPAELRGHARAYAAAMARGRGGGDVIDRAAGLYTASRLARTHGLELLGTEGAPDWNLYGAGYDLGDGELPADDPLITTGERERVAISAPAFAARYHYRYLASELAEQAADLLPPRSQAFAATLCHASRYVISVDRERADRLYRRYNAEGATVDFSSTFGARCPEPLFGSARRYLPPPVPSRTPFCAAYAAWVALLALGLLARRRRRPIA